MSEGVYRFSPSTGKFRKRYPEYTRAYCRLRYRTDPAYAEKLREANRAWVRKNRDKKNALKRASYHRRKHVIKALRALKATDQPEKKREWRKTHKAEANAQKHKWERAGIRNMADGYIRKLIRRTLKTEPTPELITKVRSEVAAKRFRRTAKYLAAAGSITQQNNHGTH